MTVENATPILASEPIAVPAEHRGSDHFDGLDGRALARIQGALGSSIVAGLDRLVVCRPTRNGRATDPADCAVWSYRLVEAVRIGRYGSLAVVVLQLRDRDDGLPLLILDSGQGPAAIDGLATLQRLIDAAPSTSVTVAQAPGAIVAGPGPALERTA